MRCKSDHHRVQDHNHAYPIETWFLHVGGLHGLLLTKHDDETFRFDSERDAIEKLRR
jgi:hypothetical protein